MNERSESGELVRDIPNADYVRIGVLGDYMLDEYVLGRVTRISPESPVPVVEHQSQYSTLGGAGNVVMNIKALGGTPVPFGIVGNDIGGRRIKCSLQDGAGVASESILVDSSRPTTVKTRIIAHNQQLLRIDAESRAPMTSELREKMLAGVRSELPKLSALIVSDYDKGVVSRPIFDTLLAACLRARVPIVLDPKAFDLSDVGPVTVITPNEREAERFSGFPVDNDSAAERAGQALLEKTGARNILITRGEHGMSLIPADGKIVHMPTQSKEVYDVTGAGDTVVAVLALALAAGRTVLDAACLANTAAGIVVGKMGTATVDREELESALAGRWPAQISRRRALRARAGLS
ncbi:MAG TPA: D-glycero-beta-D-manno-heptose-7-phosphate kinase [Bryobacteraceae bacterium]|jgi:D-beta-D-heptose 7-phosphate kinase/D-beta-D-heptose 1-phosphate adenosyltransferase|nr:D-glycero-beta-D-manno-heptose-7-phosphate kinase [Bryobacteraceae bacterium]